MGNKKVLSKATRELNKTKRFAAPKNIIEDPRGQWAHPGEITRIPSDEITMQGVPYPVMAYPNIGEPQMMYPGQDYIFPGADYVDEYPQMQEGGTTIPTVEDSGSMNEDGFWVPDWEAIAMQAKQLNAKTVKTKSGVIIYFDDNWQVQSVDENPQMKKGGTPKSLVKMPRPSKKGLASKKFSKSLDATNKLFTESPLFGKSKSKKRKVFDPNAQFQDGGLMTQEEIDGATEGMMKARLAYAYMHGNPAAQRMVVAPDQPYVFDHGDIGTHFMASMDNYAVPLIQDVNGQLMLGDFGPESAEAMRFDNPEDAMYFAENYKQITPDESYRKENPEEDYIEAELTEEEIEEYRKGGFIVEELDTYPKGGGPDKGKKGKSKSEVNQYPTEYKPVVNNIPPGISKSQLEKAGVIIGDKAIVGYEEVQQLDPTTGKVTTVRNPIYEDLEKPMPTLHPTRVNPTITGELRKFVGEEEPETDSDVMPVYDETDIESGIPEPGGHWEDKYSRYIDWDGNSIGFNGIRFRKPGHGGDLIRKGRRHYIHYPSIEKRLDAWIEPDELPEEEYQEGGSPDPKTNFYTVEGSGGVYRKVNGKWEVDWNRSGKFQPLSKGDIKERSAILNKKAQPLYDATYDDLYTTQRSAYTAPVKPTPAKKPTAQDKAAQEQFDKNFQVTGKSKMEVVEDKIQGTADDYAKYHQQQTGKPLTQEEYDDAYQDIYNRAYVDAGVYKPTMSGPTINPYGTTEERKNLVSLDPGKAPKNMTLGDYVDKGWDVVTNPLDYASYALKPKGTVTTPWNMTNYENRLEAAGLEDPVTANNNVNKAIDFASWFIGPGMVAQGLKMVPGTVNSIGRAFENPSWENTGNAVWDAGITALSIAPGFGIAKNLAKRASTVDDLKAIEALRGNTATTPFQSYYLTGNRALNASEAAIPQAQGLRRFIDPQSPQLPAGRSPIMSESTKTQLTNPAVDSYFPVRFGDEPYAAAGNEQYFVDPEDYRLFNPKTKQFEDNPNWKQEGLTNYWNYPNREGKRGTGPDFFKGINYEFKDFSPGWQAARDAKDLIMPAQRMPKKSDYFTRSEFYGMLEQEMQYKILDDERKMQEALTGKKITDAEFAEMNPGVTRPDFTKKMLTEEHRRAVNDLLRDNPSVKSNPLLKENLEAAVARSERRENALPISVTIRQDLEKYPPETLINLYGKQYAGVLPEQIASLSPKQLEKTKQTIIDRIAKRMSKAEEDFAKKNPFRPGDNPMSLNLAADTPGQLPSLTRTPKEMKALNDLRKLHSRTRTGQSNAEDVFNRLKAQKLKDLDTPDGRRRIQEHIDDNNIIKSDYVESNHDEISKRYDLRDILTNPNHEKHQVAVEGLKEELIRRGKNPSDYKLNSWDELTGDAILSNMRLYLSADDVVAKSYPDYVGGFIERPITIDEYIDHIKLLDYTNLEKNIKSVDNRIAIERRRISNLRAKRDELVKDYQKGDVSLDRYRKIKSIQEADILRAEQEILSMQMNIHWMKQDLERSNASYNFGPHTIDIGDPLTAIGDLETAVYHETGHGTDLAFLKNEKEGSKIDRDLLDEIVLTKEPPAHITQKLDLDAMSQASPYTTSNFSISKAQNPIAYWERARNYFKGPEATAFAVELRPLLKKAGLIKNDFDKVTPEMVKELYQDYITKPVWETGTRIFDIIEPVEQSFKAISKALNKIKGIAPYAIPVGLGVGAASLPQEQDGGIVTSVTDDEINKYIKEGYIVEEYQDGGQTDLNQYFTVPDNYRPTTKPSEEPAPKTVIKNNKPDLNQYFTVPDNYKETVIVDQKPEVVNEYNFSEEYPFINKDVVDNILAQLPRKKSSKTETKKKTAEPTTSKSMMEVLSQYNVSGQSPFLTTDDLNKLPKYAQPKKDSDARFAEGKKKAKEKEVVDSGILDAIGVLANPAFEYLNPALSTAYDSAKDYLDLAWNGIKRKAQTYGVIDDSDVRVKPLSLTAPLSIDDYYKDRNPIRQQVLDVPKGNGRTYKQQVVPLSNVTVGYRNRGDYSKNIKTSGLELTTFHPFTSKPKSVTDNTSVFAVDGAGNLHTGKYGDLKNNADWKFSPTFMNKIKDIRSDFQDGSVSGNPGYKQPKVTVIENGKEKVGSINLLTKGKGKEDFYGSIQGGRVLFVNPDTKEQYLVSGSLNHIKSEFKRLKGKAPYLEAWTLDNGTYSRGLSYKDGVLTKDRLKAYDNENTSGGSGLYIMDYKAPIKRYEEKYIKGTPNIRTTNSASYRSGAPLKNEVKNIVLHHTAFTDPVKNNQGVYNHFMNPTSQASAHVVIEEDGKRTVYASPEQVTFHAGKSSWNGRSNVNDFGIGVEFQGDTNKQPLTEAQIESFVEYFDDIATKYNLSTKDIITHAMVAPGRKPDITNKEYQRILKYMKSKGYK